MHGALLLVMLILPATGWADTPINGDYGNDGTATSLGDVLCDMSNNTRGFGWIFQLAAYVMGAFFVVQGIVLFKNWTDRPNEQKLSTPIMMWIGATLLLTLPTIIGTIIQSLYQTPSSGGTVVCVPPQAGGSSATTVDVLLTNMVGNIKTPMLTFVSAIAIVCGLYMIVHGLQKASKYGLDPKANSVSSILINIVFGGFLFTIGDNLKMIMGSVFGSSQVASSSAINWAIFTNMAGGASSQFQAAVIAALTFVQIIGAIAFVRGWLLLKKSVEGGGNPPMAQALTHIVGGVMAVNIYAFLKLMDNTFGTGFL